MNLKEWIKANLAIVLTVVFFILSTFIALIIAFYKEIGDGMKLFGKYFTEHMGYFSFFVLVMILTLLILSPFILKTNAIKLRKSDTFFHIALFVLLGIALFCTRYLVMTDGFDNILIFLLYSLINVFILMICIFSRKTKTHIGFVASFLPIIHENNTTNNIEIILRKNPNLGSRWMLPGGHIRPEIEDITHIQDYIKAKAKREIGIIVYFPEPSAEQETSELKTLSGASDFVFCVNMKPKDKCYESEGHRKHIDFMFIAKVTPVNPASLDRGYYHGSCGKDDNGNSYNRCRVPIDLSRITPDNTIENIRYLNSAMHNPICVADEYDRIVSVDLPQRIEIALIEYKRQLGRP